MEHWPLFALVVRTPHLELRLPNDAELEQLVALSDRGIHDPAIMPFTVPWTDQPAPYRQRASLQWWWRSRADWRRDAWTFTGAVFVDGTPVGVQDLAAERFAELRTVRTGSWLGRRYQGRGIGKEMRAAVLHLAFEGLGAERALSGAFWDNAASLAVSRQLGYADNGEEVVMRRGVPDRLRQLRLDRTRWSSTRRPDIEISGLTGPCLEMFGAGPGPPP